MISSRGEAPPLSLTHFPVGRSVGIAPSLNLTDAGMMAYVRRPQLQSHVLPFRNRLAGDDQDDLTRMQVNHYSPTF